MRHEGSTFCLGHETRGMGFKMRVGGGTPPSGLVSSGRVVVGGVLHPNAAAAEAAPRVYKLAFRVGSAALGAA